MKYIKIITVLFFIIIISVIPYCLYREHIVASEMEKHIVAGEKIKHEGLELLLPFGYGVYSIIFIIWTSNIYLNITAETIKKRIFELVAIFIFGVIPALCIDRLFYVVTS